jgi:hypothetical protein
LIQLQVKNQQEQLVIMVATRTQTGTIEQKHYDPASLTKLTLRTSPETSPVSRAQRSPRLSKRHPTPKSPTKKRTTTHHSPQVYYQEPKPNYIAPDVCGGINFFPRRAWGEREDHLLTAVERAERDIEIWEEVKRSHAEGGLPQMVPGIEQVIEWEREKMADLKRTERENGSHVG